MTSTRESFLVRIYLVISLDRFVYDLSISAVNSKIVVNIHQYEDSALESHRINNMMSLGKCVISERSRSDPLLDSEYEQMGAILFVDRLEDIYEVVKRLLADEEKRQTLQELAVEKYWAIQNDTYIMQHVMQYINLLP